jgi:phosphohistidine phosphatase
MSLELFVVRHAIAEERAADKEDASRALTERGRERFGKGVRGLARLGFAFDRIDHSPWLRAVQTAELLTPLLDHAGETRVSAELAAPPARALLEGLGEGRVALVGHEPWLSELVALLVSGDAGDGAGFEFKKGAVAWLEGEPRPGAMTLRALLPPRVLRRLR